MTAPQQRLSLAQIATIVGVGERQVKRDKAAGAPVYDIEAYKLWRASHRAASPRAETLGTVTTRLRGAQADLAELDAAVRRGDLIEVEDVRQALQAAAVTFSSQLEALPGRVANELAAITDPALIRARLLDECRRIRTSVAEEFNRLAVQDARRNGHSSAAADAGRVGGPDADPSAGQRGAGTVPQ